MASEYLLKKYKDVKPDEERELTPKEKRQNWWYYHKWHVVIGFILLLICLDLGKSALHIGEVKPDLQIAYDKTAFQCCRKLRSMGIDIPGQVQVIGFDGVRMMDTESLYCSTIVQPVDKLAEAAVNTLLSEDRSSLICLPVTFAQGGTTKEI